MRRILFAVLGVAVSAVALLLAFADVRFSDGLRIVPRMRLADLRDALASARPGWLAAYLALNLASLLPRALQLRALARRRDGTEPRLAAAWHAYAVGLLAQNLLPARLGEAARVVALGRADDVAPAAAAAAVLFGRVLDLVAIILTACVPSLLLEVGAFPRLRTVAIAGSAVAVALMLMLLLLYRRRDALARLAHRLGPRTGLVVSEFADGLSALGSPERLVEAAASSLATPLLIAASYACALRAFGLGWLPTGSSLVLVATVLLAVAIPSAPSSLGVYHAAVTRLLPRLGAPTAASAAYAIVTHALGVVAFVAVGAYSMARVGLRPSVRALQSPGLRAT
jgi:uncharacterized protein (TIRG00374 family)